MLIKLLSLALHRNDTRRANDVKRDPMALLRHMTPLKLYKVRPSRSLGSRSGILLTKDAV